eukprot:815821-Alexandrium_andersonii.AAC.1
MFGASTALAARVIHGRRPNVAGRKPREPTDAPHSRHARCEHAIAQLPRVALWPRSAAQTASGGGKPKAAGVRGDDRPTGAINRHQGLPRQRPQPPQGG